MNDVLTTIYGHVGAIHPNTYIEEVPQDETVYPQAILTIDVAQSRELHDELLLVVDVYDNLAEDTTRLDDTATAINKALHKQTINEASSMVRIHRQPSSYMIPEPDAQLRRRQMRYRLKLYTV